MDIGVFGLIVIILFYFLIMWAFRLFIIWTIVKMIGQLKENALKSFKGVMKDEQDTRSTEDGAKVS